MLINSVFLLAFEALLGLLNRGLLGIRDTALLHEAEGRGHCTGIKLG